MERRGFVAIICQNVLYPVKFGNMDSVKSTENLICKTIAEWKIPNTITDKYILVVPIQRLFVLQHFFLLRGKVMDGFCARKTISHLRKDQSLGELMDPTSPENLNGFYHSWESTPLICTKDTNSYIFTGKFSLLSYMYFKFTGWVKFTNSYKKESLEERRWSNLHYITRVDTCPTNHGLFKRPLLPLVFGIYHQFKTEKKCPR